MVLSALPILAVSYYFTFRSGCLFDGKQGYGDINAAAVFEKWSLLADIVAIAIYSFGIYRLCLCDASRTAAMLLLSSVIGLPLVFWLSFEGEIAGTQSCDQTLTAPR